MKTQQIKFSSDEYLMKKRRKKRLVRILFWFKIIMFVSLTVTMLILLCLSPIFNIKRIEVNGNQHYRSDEIEKSTGIVIGSNGFKSVGSSLKNIFTLRVGESENLLRKTKPYIKKVIVRYVPPWTVRVTVEERKPVAMLSFMGSNIIVDKEGYALDDNIPNDVKRLPLLLGINIKDFELGQALKFRSGTDSKGFSTAMELLTAITDSDDMATNYKLYHLIDSVDVSDPENVLLGFDGRFKVNFGHLQDIEHNLNFFRHIYYSILKNSDDKGILDMTAKDPVLIEE